jgi:SAM-dependent methyltransferase
MSIRCIGLINRFHYWPSFRFMKPIGLGPHILSLNFQKSSNILLDGRVGVSKQGKNMSTLQSVAYKSLCCEFYEADKPHAPQDALACYAKYCSQAKGGAILEPMCGSGRFLIPLAQKGYSITGFDTSPSMLDMYYAKCKQNLLPVVATNASFDNFSSKIKYSLIMIPSGSFCLLTDEKAIHKALKVCHDYLDQKGKFVFEIDTPSSIMQPQNVWNGNWVTRSDGAKIVQSYMAHFDPSSSIQTSMHRYELWEKNKIVETQVEEFYLRLYTMQAIESLLPLHGFQVINKFQPYTTTQPDEKADAVLYECVKL